MPQAADMAFEVRLRAAAVPLIGSGIWGFGFRVSGAAVRVQVGECRVLTKFRHFQDRNKRKKVITAAIVTICGNQ